LASSFSYLFVKSGFFTKLYTLLDAHAYIQDRQVWQRFSN
jgi:hypothetical protein